MTRTRPIEKTIEAVIGNGQFSVDDVREVYALAQLGARVLEILRQRAEENPVGVHRDALANINLLCRIDGAARSLGLLEARS